MFSWLNAVWAQIDECPPGATILCLLQQELNWKEGKANTQMGRIFTRVKLQESPKVKVLPTVIQEHAT